METPQKREMEGVKEAVERGKRLESVIQQEMYMERYIKKKLCG